MSAVIPLIVARWVLDAAETISTHSKQPVLITEERTARELRLQATKPHKLHDRSHGRHTGRSTRAQMPRDGMPIPDTGDQFHLVSMQAGVNG